MAFDQTTRNRLARFVSDTRALLTEEFTRQLQNEYGLDPTNGEVTPIERLTALDDTQRETARVLRETMDYYLAGNPSANIKADRDVLDRIVREQAFTVLNRLCALRMSEARGLVLESIAKSYQSRGFQLYARLAGSALGETGQAYRGYLFSLMDEFAVDLPVLFDRFSPQGRLFPREAALLKLLELINDPEVDPLWTEDETIGWIYQYFNTKEERKAMRDASQAPRNSRELAVRNQFFTPRYVVEFLTDNTLGRIWYEMTRGETALIDSCQYLVQRKHAFFLTEEQSAPEPFLPEQQHETDPDIAHEMWLPPNDQISDLETIFLYAMTTGGYEYAKEHWGIECSDLANEKLKQYHETGKWEGTFEELRCCLFFEQRRYHHFGQGPNGDDAKAILELYQAIYERWNLEVEFIPYRPLKDPREIKMLDPACGSMHFGLYAFDLLEQIYTEAWEIEDRLGEDSLQRLADLEPLHKTYPNKDTYIQDVPRLIIERNIHGVDIDARAVQIAGLSLWLRAQKSWQVQGLKSGERPQVIKSNVVCAEPMPGDRKMLEEFLGTLRGEELEVLMRKAWHIPSDRKVRATPQMAEASARLVRKVWDEMELAGEAGSLLKVEETLRAAIAAARKESEEKAPLFRVLEYGLNETPKEQIVQLVSGADQDFFDRVEGLVLAALHEYTNHIEYESGYQWRLFTDDTQEGFKFINLFRKSFDVILMNPPFGLQTPTLEIYCKTKYPNTWQDVYACFWERIISKASYDNGIVGTITPKSYYHAKGFKGLRTILTSSARLVISIDIGSGVLDAAVEVCLSITDTRPCNSSSFADFINLVDSDRSLINEELLNSISKLSSGSISSRYIPVRLFDRQNLPNQMFSYRFPPDFLKTVLNFKSFESEYGRSVVGITTFDNYRFIRLYWELTTSSINFRDWVPIAMGGGWAPFYNGLNEYVAWKDNADEMRSNEYMNYQTNARTMQSSQFWYLSGLTFSKISKAFSVQPFPRNAVFSSVGFCIFPNDDDFWWWLGYLNSKPICLIMSLFSADRHWHSNSVASLPIPDNRNFEISQISQIIYGLICSIERINEISPEFVCPYEIDVEIYSRIKEYLTKLDELVCESLHLSNETTKYLERQGKYEEYKPSAVIQEKFQNKCSYLIGCLYGRWDIRYITGDRKLPKCKNPFEELPICPPGMLQNELGLQMSPKEVPNGYPIKISWSGILVDDEGHKEDIYKRVSEAFLVIWRDQSEALEQEFCQQLGTHSLREYFRKPIFFFADHLRRYSKSHRAAPIYWPISTPSCSYTLWLYYNRLNDQTLYTCVNDYIDPKLKQVSEEAARLRLKKGRSAADEKELERLTDFERELKDFREELLCVAKFWKPNLNDGVEITAAPLWKFFQHKPWQKRLKETWQKLEDGEYDWAHLAYSIWPVRVKEKCKSDKSLAIAHNLESLYAEPVVPLKKKKNKKQAADEDTEGWFNDD